MRPMPALCAALVATTLGLAAADALAVNCFVVFDRTENVIYRDVFPPVDLSDAGKADREAMRQRGEFLMFMDAEQCPRLEFLTGAAGNVALRLDETLAPTREPAKPATPQAAPRAPRAPR
jgi:hypothetical protein